MFRFITLQLQLPHETNLLLTFNLKIHKSTQVSNLQAIVIQKHETSQVDMTLNLNPYPPKPITLKPPSPKPLNPPNPKPLIPRNPKPLNP